MGDRLDEMEQSLGRRERPEVGESANPKADRFLRDYRRRASFLFVLFASLFGVQTGLVLALGSGELDAMVRGSFLVVFAAGVLAVYLLERHAMARLTTLMRLAGPRLRNAGVLWRSGPLFVFDNGLMLAFDRTGPEFSIAASVGGSTEPPPEIAEVNRMRSTRWRMKAVALVSSRTGPEAARATLEEVRRALDVKRCMASVLERPAHLPLDARAQAWVATLTLFDFRWDRKVPKILDSLDRLRDFLVDMRQKHAPPGTSLRESMGLPRGSRRRGGTLGP